MRVYEFIYIAQNLIDESSISIFQKILKTVEYLRMKGVLDSIKLQCEETESRWE